MELNPTQTIVAIIFGAIGVFLALREVMLWYWKVNEINGYLKRIANKLDPEGAPPKDELDNLKP